MTALQNYRLAQAYPHNDSPGPSMRYLAMLGSILLLMLTGVVMALAASNPASIGQDGGALSEFGRHATHVTFGIFALLFTVGRDYRSWRRAAPLLLVAACLGLVLVLLFGHSSGGSRRWLDLGLFGLQPSEITKLALVVSLASFLDQRRYFLDRIDRVTIPVAVGIAVLCGLILKQPDLGTAAILGSIAFGMMWAAGVPFRHLGLLLVLGLVSGLFLALAEPYRRGRIIGFFSAAENSDGAGYQVTQGLASLSNGGFRGTGLSAGHAQWGWVPEAPNDFVFAVVGEQLGFVGALAVLVLLATIIVTGFCTAQIAPDVFGSLLAAGISVWFLLQVLVNLGGVLRLLPISGVTLPFISSGGTSLIVNAAAAGLLLNIARQSK